MDGVQDCIFYIARGMTLENPKICSRAIMEADNDMLFIVIVNMLSAASHPSILLDELNHLLIRGKQIAALDKLSAAVTKFKLFTCMDMHLN